MQIGRPHVRLRPGTIGSHRPRDHRGQRPNLVIIDTKHRQPIERQMVQELHESTSQAIEIVAVSAHVVSVDIGHDRDHGLEIEERGVALVGLGHQIFGRPQFRIRPGAVEPPADDESGIEPPLGQDARHQAGGGRLAMGARHRDAMVEAHEFGQHLGAPHDGNARGPSALDFGIGFVDRGGNHHGIGNRDLFRPMANEDLDAKPPQPTGDIALAQVRSGHLITQIRHEFSDAAHAGTANPDEMQATHPPHPRCRVLKMRVHGVLSPTVCSVRCRSA